MKPADSESAYPRVQTTCLVILTFIASGTALAVLKPVLVPFVLALLLAYCLSPLIDMQVRHLRLPRGLAIVTTALLAMLVLAGAGLLVAISASKMSGNLGLYRSRLDGLVVQVMDSGVARRLGLKHDSESGRLFALSEDAVNTFLTAVLTETTALVSNGTMVAIFAIFILMGRRPHRPAREPLLEEIEHRIRHYILQVVFFSGLTAVLVGASLGMLGVDFFWIFAFLAFLLNFIPSLGAVIATLLPLPVILLDTEMSPTAKVLAIVLPGLIQFVIGNLIQPKVQGSSLELHPVAVLLGLMFFGMIWGMVGAFLATPITAVIKIVLDRIPVTQNLGRLLAGEVDSIDRLGEPGPGSPSR